MYFCNISDVPLLCFLVYLFIFNLDEEIKQNEGFKNVSLGNVISSSYTFENANYLNKKDQVSIIFRYVY